jgi:exopolysaccharide biosynthesis polyprenyl glycosylphosphotransferase
MLKRFRLIFVLSVYAIELLFTLCVFFVAYLLRAGPLVTLFGKFEGLGSVLWLFIPTLIVWAILLWRYRFQAPTFEGALLSNFGRAMLVVVLGTTMLFAISYATKQFYVSRAFLGLFAGLDLVALVSARSIAQSLFRHYVRRGYDRTYILIAGTGGRARKVARLLEQHREHGLELVGYLSETGSVIYDEIQGRPVLGPLDRLPQILQSRSIDEVHVAIPRTRWDRVAEIVRICDKVGVKVRIPLYDLDGLYSRASLQYLSNLPFLTLASSPTSQTQLLIKRVIDVVLASLGLVASLPILLVSAMFIKITSPGPVIFRQRRVGMNGRAFWLYKLRTMVPDAEQRLQQVKHLNEMRGPVFKIKNDPRVTPFGRLLRVLSIDELPQLWNVLKGDMSLVGPRPPLPTEVQKYQLWQRRRLSMRPGITCLWQVSGRNTIDFEEWMKLDMQYIDSWSLGLDLKILLRTIPSVLARKGAS